MRPRDALRDQAASCRALGSALAAAVCEVLAGAQFNDAGAQRVRAWPENSSSRGDSPLLRLRLGDGRAAPRRWPLTRVDFHGRWIDWNPGEENG